MGDKNGFVRGGIDKGDCQGKKKHCTDGEEGGVASR